MACVTGDDVRIKVNNDQLCSGIKGGIEGAIHGISQLFESQCEDGGGLLLVDADNAFNSMKRSAGLWNARVLWTRCSRFLFNTYQGYAVLIIRGAKTYILSKEGVTQGDPLGMMFYAIALLPLTRKLKNGSAFLKTVFDRAELNNTSAWTQNWYADDSSCQSDLESILVWLQLLVKEGPKYGYYPSPEKSYLVVHPNFVERAQTLFADFKVNVVTGFRFLGGFIGDFQETENWINEKVKTWVKAIECLSKAAEQQPHLAHVSLTKSLQNEWSYVQRVVANVEKPFTLLRTALESTFLPALFGSEVNQAEISLMLLSGHNGGLGIRDPVNSSTLSFQSSREGSKILSDSIIDGISLEMDLHETQMKKSIHQARELRDSLEQDIWVKTSNGLPIHRQKTLQRIKDGECSTWLSMMPTHDNNFLLGANECRDSIALRYGRVPIKCLDFVMDAINHLT